MRSVPQISGGSEAQPPATQSAMQSFERHTMKRISLVLLLLAISGAAAAEETKDGWIRLFDGKTLNGWKPSEHASNWKVVDGAIVASGPRSHLFYVGDDANNPAEFKDFHFKAEVMTKPGSNSGIFFHTHFVPDNWPAVGHEAQVNNTFKPDPQKTAGIYNIVKVLKSPATDDKWFTYEIIVRGSHITTKIDGKTIVEYDEPQDVKGDRKLSRGLFALQAHDPGSTTFYKNLSVKRLAQNED